MTKTDQMYKPKLHQTVNLTDSHTVIKTVKSSVPVGMALISDSTPSARHQLQLQNHGHGADVLHSCLITNFRQYQFILPGDRDTWVRTTCLELLPDSDPAGNRTQDHLI